VANFSTNRDLREDALWIAGESTTSASAYYARSLAYLNAAYTALLAGGPLGTIVLPAIDWWWSQKTASATLVIPNSFNADRAVTVTATNNSTTVGFSAMPTGLSLAGYRGAFEDDVDQLMYVSAHTAGATSGALALAWQRPTHVSNRALFWVDTIALPTDFSRFTTSLRIGRSPHEIPLVDQVMLERDYPRHRVWVGTPRCAAIVNRGASALGLRMSHALDDGPLVAEFEYMTKPTELVDAVGTEEPPIPAVHRRVLSLGAAYLMLFDKVDSKHREVGKMFSDAWEAMAEEHYRQVTDNQNFGRILSRPLYPTVPGSTSGFRYP
jgi:hypothetical protein